MRFLNKLLELDYVEWNYVTKGLMEVWEFTRTLGLELQFETLLHESENAELAIKLGRAAHDKNLLRQITSYSNSRFGNDWVISLSPHHAEFINEKLLMTILDPLIKFDTAVCSDLNLHNHEMQLQAN